MLKRRRVGRRAYCFVEQIFIRVIRIQRHQYPIITTILLKLFFQKTVICFTGPILFEKAGFIKFEDREVIIPVIFYNQGIFVDKEGKKK